MRVNGIYVGIGEGDESDEVGKIIDHVRKMYTPARNNVAPGRKFTAALTAEIAREQATFVLQGKLKPGEFIPGVVNLAWKYASAYLKREVILPIHFSTEGHMSDMWIGPAAYVGQVLAAEGRALHFPTWYDRFALPFKNQDGVKALAARVGALQFTLDDGKIIKFPEGTRWTASSFSQGSMIWCDFYRQYLLPGKPLHWRLKDLRAAIVCGNPDREKGKCASWIPDPPPEDHQGIMDDANRMVDTPWWWLEVARAKDLYTDNESTGERGANKTAIARIITQNKWSGGPTGLLSRVVDILSSPMDDVIPITLALYDTIRFGAGGLKQHGGYDMEPAVQFCRERLAAAA